MTAIALAVDAPVSDASEAASQPAMAAGVVDAPADLATDAGGKRLWGRQPGTSGFDAARGVATDSDGAVYIAGQTQGALGGPFNGGDIDAFVIKYDRNGRRLWAQQPGTSFADFANGIAADEDGNIYVVGGTQGALAGPGKGDFDAFLAKYDRNGDQLWVRQPGSRFADSALGVATDKEGDVYVVGETSGPLGGPKNGTRDDTDAFVIKYDRDGHRLWAHQPGTSGADRAWSVATDLSGSVYIAGGTEGALGGAKKGGKDDQDAFVIKYDRDGHRVWARQPGTSGFDVATAVATDANGNVYVVGDAGGALAGPDREGAFVIKYDGDGNRLWARQPATNKGSNAYAASTDANGNLYVAGSTIAGLGGPYKGTEDAFVIKYDPDGHVLWLRQFGRNLEFGGDFPQGVATEANGNVYLAGLTWGALAGPNKGNGDAFVIKFTGGSTALAAPGM